MLEQRNAYMVAVAEKDRYDLEVSFHARCARTAPL